MAQSVWTVSSCMSITIMAFVLALVWTGDWLLPLLSGFTASDTARFALLAIRRIGCMTNGIELFH
jgi:hypothetical protein